MRISARLRAAQESATLAVQQAAARLKARGVDVVDLGIARDDQADASTRREQISHGGGARSRPG